MKSGKRDLSLYAHLDAKPLHFHKDGEQSLKPSLCLRNFRRKGKACGFAGAPRPHHSAGTNARTAQVRVDASMTFQFKPGIYRIAKSSLTPRITT